MSNLKEKDFFAALIRTAYFPMEIPPAITAKQYSDFCKNEFKFLKNNQAALIKKTTKYDTFTAPRTSNGRRNLAIVHPHAQAGLSLLLAEHRKEIGKIISSQKHSLYEVSEDRNSGKAFSGLNFRKWDALVAQVCSECQIIMSADISRFFYTAYTHSIPWAILGKENVKNWLETNPERLKRHWTHSLDTALQSCQSRETFGIPVGPDTSRIIAELLLSGVEQDSHFVSATKGKKFTRLMDDYIIGFDDEQEANKAQSALRTALWKYNLQLNEDKTGVRRSCLHYRPKWKIEYDSISINKNDEKQQERDIYNLIDMTFHFCEEFKTSQPAHWACRRLSELNARNNFGIVLDALFRLARDFPTSTNHVAAFLINNQSRFNDALSRKRAIAWIKSTLRTHAPQSHDFEVAWCLCASAALKITINEQDLPIEQPSSAIFAILGMLRERKLLTVSLSKWNWRAHLRGEGIHGKHWLPFYEAVRRGWTNDKSLINAVNGNPIFKKMLEKKVSFLEDRLLDATEIDLSKRIFIKKKKDPSKYFRGLVFDEYD